jgi:AcrR family transcriptional regulator
MCPPAPTNVTASAYAGSTAAGDSTAAPDPTADAEPPAIGSDVDPLAGLGLRERSKVQRRSAIQRAAMQLFAQQGYDQTTITEIAEAAGVSRRTISAYFPTKLAIATAYADAIADRAMAIFTEHREEGLLATVDRWLTAEETTFFDPPLAAMASAMYVANPALEAIGSARVGAAADLGRTLLVEESGADVDETRLRVGEAAIMAVFNSYIGEINTNGPSAQRHRAVIEVLAALIDAILGRGADATA